MRALLRVAGSLLEYMSLLQLHRRAIVGLAIAKRVSAAHALRISAAHALRWRERELQQLKRDALRARLDALCYGH